MAFELASAVVDSSMAGDVIDGARTVSAWDSSNAATTKIPRDVSRIEWGKRARSRELLGKIYLNAGRALRGNIAKRGERWGGYST